MKREHKRVEGLPLQQHAELALREAVDEVILEHARLRSGSPASRQLAAGPPRGLSRPNTSAGAVGVGFGDAGSAASAAERTDELTSLR